MGLCFHSSDYYLSTSPSPVGGDGIEDSDLDSPPEACPSSTRYLPRHKFNINHNPKAEHPQRPFKWSTRRLHSIHQTAYEHWLWSSNYYWSHHDPSKQAPFRIKPHQVRAILDSKAIGPKRVGVEPFVRTWTKRDLVKRRRQDEQRSWKQQVDVGLGDRDCEEVQLPFERERERSKRRQQRRRPPSLERQDAFRDEGTSKRREGMIRRDGLSWDFPVCGAMDTREKHDGDGKIRVVGYDQGVYEKEIYEAAARGEISWPQRAQNLKAEDPDLKSRVGLELTRLYQNRLWTEIRHFRARRTSTSKKQEHSGQLFGLDITLAFSAHGEDEALFFSPEEVTGDKDEHMPEAPLLEDIYEVNGRDDEEDEEWEILDESEASYDGTPPFKKTAAVATEDDFGPWVFVSPSP